MSASDFLSSFFMFSCNKYCCAREEKSGERYSLMYEKKAKLIKRRKDEEEKNRNVFNTFCAFQFLKMMKRKKLSVVQGFIIAHDKQRS